MSAFQYTIKAAYAAWQAEERLKARPWWLRLIPDKITQLIGRYART